VYFLRLCGFLVLFLLPVTNPLVLTGMWKGVAWSALGPLETNIFWVIQGVLALCALVCFVCPGFLVRHTPLGHIIVRRGGGAAALLGLLGVGAFVGVWELSFYGLRVLFPPAILKLRGVAHQGLVDPKPRYGWRYKPSICFPHKVTRADTGETVYNVTYCTDDYGFRVTSPPSPEANQHLVFFGCSYTFGLGVEDKEVYVDRIAQRLPQYHVYNFGTGGWGPGQALLLWEDGVVQQRVSEAHGKSFYLFIGHHAERVYPSMRAANQVWYRTPTFALTPEREAVYLGPFNEVYPWRMLLYTWLYREQFIRWSMWDFPPPPNWAGFEQCAAVFSTIKKRYAAHFGTEAFYVLLSWGELASAGFNPERARKIFSDYGVSVIDITPAFARLSKGWNEGYYPEGHWKPFVHEFVAEHLLQWLAEHP